MASNRDPFFDDGDTTAPPVITETRHEQPISEPTSPREVPRRPSVRINDPTITPRSLSPPLATTTTSQQPPEITYDDFEEPQSSSSQSSRRSSITREQPIPLKTIPSKNLVDTMIQTDSIPVRDESIQTEILQQTPSFTITTTVSRPFERKIVTEKRHGTPLVKNLFEQSITSALPIISFCQPFSMTSHANDIILAMPRHFMVITNQNAVSVYPWQQSEDSSSTILECFWCSFLYKLLVTTLEDNHLHIYDFSSIVDSIKLRGQPLTIKHDNSRAKQLDSSSLLPTSSRYQPKPVLWSQTRFTKSNSLGIYYCYISERQYSCMLTRVDHNTRQHIKAIDCTGGSLDHQARICALGLSEDRVAIVLTNLIMTLYDAETLMGLKQINLSRWSHHNIRGVCTLMYLWKTWLLFDPIDNQVVGIGRRKRRFTKPLPEQPINACPMDDGTLALWLGYPGAILYYRLMS